MTVHEPSRLTGAVAQQHRVLVVDLGDQHPDDLAL